jgi:hypothetical protein
MGEAIHTIQDGADPGTASAIEKGWRFVRSEAVRFQEGRDDKHAKRYAALQEYMQTRLAIWGLQHLRGHH